MDVSLRYKTENFIDVSIGNEHEAVWRFTGMYGEPRWQNKHLTWQRLRDLHAIANMPWLVMGHLYGILYPFEKDSGNPRPPDYMQAFRAALEECKRQKQWNFSFSYTFLSTSL